MLSFFQKLFNCDEKACRLEFYIYILASLIPLVLFFPFLSLPPLAVIPVYISLGIIVCAIYRRAKDRSMTNDTIINYMAKISLLFWTGFIFSLIITLYFGLLRFNALFPTKYVWSYILWGMCGIYTVIFLFQILFLKGKNIDENEPKVATFKYKKPTYPKIGEIFNRDFFVNIVNFKGIATREGSFIYLALILIIDTIILIRNNMLINIFDNICYLYYSFFNTGGGCEVIEPGELNYTWEWWVLGISLLLILSLCCRRLRDLNIKPWKVIFLLLPPVNIFMIVLMLLGKSEK